MTTTRPHTGPAAGERRGVARHVPADTGRVVKVSGPVISGKDLSHTRLFDVVRVGGERLLGEVIKIDGDLVVMQVFEDTTGLRVGEPVEATGEPLYAELGPGLLGSILDGTQRPLENLSTDDNLYVAKGVDPPRLDRDRRWHFRPAVELGDRVGPGDLLGTVPEGRAIEHRILVPAGLAGIITAVRPGPTTVLGPVAEIDGHPVAMLRRWPLAAPPRASGREPTWAHGTAGHRPADPRPALSHRPRRQRHHPRRFRDRKDRARAGPRQVLDGRHRGLRRLR